MLYGRKRFMEVVLFLLDGEGVCVESSNLELFTEQKVEGVGILR